MKTSRIAESIYAAANSAHREYQKYLENGFDLHTSRREASVHFSCFLQGYLGGLIKLMNNDAIEADKALIEAALTTLESLNPVLQKAKTSPGATA